MSTTVTRTSTSAVEVSGLRVLGPAGETVAPFDFTIPATQTLALMGESGSGETLSAKALAGLLPRRFSAQGTISVPSATIELPATGAVWKETRGRGCSLLLQDPFTSIRPLHRRGRPTGINRAASRS